MIIRPVSRPAPARQVFTLVGDQTAGGVPGGFKAKAHNELISAAYRAQGDALLIESQAKIRLADEYDAAQERGEVATVGQPSIVPDGNDKPATAEDIGLTRKQVHEARQIRDAEAVDPGIVRRTITGLCGAFPGLRVQ